MQTLSISLPDQFKDYIDQQIAGGEFASISDYFLQLLQKDREQKEEDQVEAFLNESLNDDEEERELTPAEWADIRNEALTALQSRQS